MRIFITLLLSLFLFKCQQSNQTNVPQYEIPQNPKTYQHEVMVLGSFHFNKSGDASDVVGKNHLDVTTEQSQQILNELTQRIIDEFDPTIIAVEAMSKRQSYVDSLYQSYQNDQWELRTNEIFQLGFRIAKKNNLDRVYCVDNRPIQPQSVLALDDWEGYADSIGHSALWEEYDVPNKQYNNYLDSLLLELNLEEYLHLINSPENIRRNKELWFTGLVNLGHGDKFIGADLTGHWYLRNTRIFTNIRNACASQQERVLVIYGVGHKWVLDEIFMGSPEFQLKQPNEYILTPK